MARIENTLAKGAQLACGGSPSQVALAPTVLAGATGAMTAMLREAFGPAVAVAPAAGVEEVIVEINAVASTICPMAAPKPLVSGARACGMRSRNSRGPK